MSFFTTLTKVLFLGVIFLKPLMALAQVNTDPLVKDPFISGISSQLNVNLSLSNGNVNVIDVGGLANVQYQELFEPHQELKFIKKRYQGLASARFGRKENEIFADQRFAYLRYVHMLIPKVGVEAYSQYQFNEFLRLKLRAIVGSNATFEFIHNKQFILSYATGYMLEYQEINVEAGAADQSTTLEHRFAQRLRARLETFNHKLFVQNTLLLQPRFDDFSDVRILEEVETLIPITDVIAFGLVFSVSHDSRPPTGVLKNDIRLLNTFQLSLK